jgi:type IV secretion system protein VirD4
VDETARPVGSPTSSFEDPENIAAAAPLRYAPGKLFLGLLGASIERDNKTGERFAQGGMEIGVADDRHAITVAGTRAGKGRAAIIPNMLRYSGSVLAIDPKGELVLATAAVRAKKLGQRVCVPDPFSATEGALQGFYAGFNPIARMRPKSLIEDAGLIADALVVFEATGTDPHWDESARSFIEGVILEVATAERFAGRRKLVTRVRFPSPAPPFRSNT